MSKQWIKLPGGAAGYGCECMAKTLPLIEADMLKQGLIKKNLDIWQWGYNPGKVGASAGTHDLGGVVDTGQYSLAQRKVWAKWGVMMFPRTTQFGWTSGDHGHGVWHGCSHQVPYTDWQVRSGLAGGDGLGSSATLMGRAWRYFEAPTKTWQEAVKAYATPAPAPTPTKEEDMPLSDADIRKIANAVWTQAVGREQAITADGKKVPMNAMMALQSIYHTSRGSTGTILKRIANKLGV